MEKPLHPLELGIIDITIDILKSSLANPENRRAELMVRMSGFEQYADNQEHIGMFYTITCPSKYHRFMGKNLQKNTKYNGATPKDAQNYLVVFRHALHPTL